MHPLVSLMPGDKFVMEIGSPASTLPPPPMSEYTQRQTATGTTHINVLFLNTVWWWQQTAWHQQQWTASDSEITLKWLSSSQSMWTAGMSLPRQLQVISRQHSHQTLSAPPTQPAPSHEQSPQFPTPSEWIHELCQENCYVSIHRRGEETV